MPMQSKKSASKPRKQKGSVFATQSRVAEDIAPSTKTRACSTARISADDDRTAGIQPDDTQSTRLTQNGDLSKCMTNEAPLNKKMMLLSESRYTTQQQQLLPLSNSSSGGSINDNKGAPDTHHEGRSKRVLPPMQGPWLDICCHCSGNHDVRFCPIPNTADGRLKVCFVCQTTEHAWFQCVDFTRDSEIEFQYLWTNRIRLPIIVHDRPLHKIYRTKIDKLAGDCTRGARRNLKAMHKRCGPLTPKFVQALLEFKQVFEHTDDLEHQLGHGRYLPWEVPDAILRRKHDERIAWLISDPHTRKMAMSVKIPQPFTGRKSDPKVSRICIALFRHRNCWCDRHARHRPEVCSSFCRECVANGKQVRLHSCREHCPVHVDWLGDSEEDDCEHDNCRTEFKGDCPECGHFTRHWPQDCLAYVKDLCVRCMKIECEQHCPDCGLDMDEFKDFVDELDSSTAGLLDLWHEKGLHGQWQRSEKSFMTAENKGALQCTSHAVVTFGNWVQLDRNNMREMESIVNQVQLGVSCIMANGLHKCRQCVRAAPKEFTFGRRRLMLG